MEELKLAHDLIFSRKWSNGLGFFPGSAWGIAARAWMANKRVQPDGTAPQRQACGMCDMLYDHLEILSPERRAGLRQEMYREYKRFNGTAFVC